MSRNHESQKSTHKTLFALRLYMFIHLVYPIVLLTGMGCEPENRTPDFDGIEVDLAAEDAPEIPLKVLYDNTPHLTKDDIPQDVLEVMRQDLEHTQRHVVGKENRSRVETTREWPYSSVVKLYTYWYEDEEPHNECTGSLIEEDAVLTAAHCVFDLEYGLGSAYKITVVPGLYPGTDASSEVDEYKPFGVGSGRKLYYPWSYVKLVDSKYHRIPYDYAVIRLKSPFTDTGVRSYGSILEPLGWRAILAAYHYDIEDGRQMTLSADKVRKVLDNGTFNHYIDHENSASGGGITSTGAWKDKIFGIVSSSATVNATGAKYNIGTLITEESLTSIRSWATCEI